MVELPELLAVVRDRDRLQTAWSDIPNYLGSFQDRLSSHAPARTTALIAIPTAFNRARRDWSLFVAIARFRTPFSIIEELSRILASTALQSGVVPTVMPIGERAFDTMTWDTPFVRSLQKAGVLLYERKMQL
jgi:hypothetical protein